MTEPPINPMQAMLDGMGAAWQKQRADTQMTLGELIDVLDALPEDAEVRGIGEPGSYRGYYEDLAFDPTDEAEPVADVLERVRSCMGETFMGYKGGDFMMGRSTPVWSAPWGVAFSDRIMEIVEADDGVYEPRCEEEEGWS